VRAAHDYNLLGKRPVGPAPSDDGPDEEEAQRAVAAAPPRGLP
jgi:hypothetical protein